MKKILALFLLLACATSQAGEAEIRKSLQSKYPTIGALEHIAKTPYSGLYEIMVDDRILYTDELGQYLIMGNIIDVKTRADLTERRQQELFDFNKLPLELAVKRVKGNGSRKMMYFTDPNCGYCKKLEKELANVNNVTLYLFMYPIFQGSDEIVRNIQCSKDPIKAWDNLMLKGIAPAEAKCKTSVDKVMDFAHKRQVNGTPNLIFANGTQVPGYLPAEKLEQLLNESNKK